MLWRALAGILVAAAVAGCAHGDSARGSSAHASSRTSVAPATWAELRDLYHHWLGAGWAAPRDWSLTARVTSPRGPFSATLATNLDGHTSIVRTFPDRSVTLELDGSHGREQRSGVPGRDLSPSEVAVGHWHDVLAFVLRIDRFVGAPGPVETVRDGDSRFVVTARGPAGEPVRARFAADARLIGFGLDGVDIIVDAWQEVDGVQLPRTVIFRDAGGDWTYRFAAPRRQHKT